jgi:acyl transferase domain-containing protein
MLSPRGRCHAFADGADGYVRAEGGGVVVLKPLSTAIADGDRVHAVIRATGVNSDGHTVGLSSPIRRRRKHCGRCMSVLSWTQSNWCTSRPGTGTAAGDPIECGAVGRVLWNGTRAGSPSADWLNQDQPRAPGASFGYGGTLAKAVLILRHGEIPASLHGLPSTAGSIFLG